MKITDQKAAIKIGLIYLIIFAVFNMLVFVISKHRNGVFWVSYLFCCIAFIVQIASMFLAFRTIDVEAVFFGIPLVSLSLYYFFAGVFVGVVFMIFQFAPMKLAVVLQLLILAAYAIVAIVSLLTRDTVQAVNDNIKDNVQIIKTQSVNVDTLIGQTGDSRVRAALKNLKDTIQYSDPMSNAAVADLDAQISKGLNDLRIDIQSGNNDNAVRMCQDIELLYQQRNGLLKATK
jgi:glucan phosphoethanolaminetransferase (alkaline phosphatase superfamily)